MTPTFSELIDADHQYIKDILELMNEFSEISKAGKCEVQYAGNSYILLSFPSSRYVLTRRL